MYYVHTMDMVTMYFQRYQERLELKYQKATALNSRSVLFVRNDMGDMRSGKPIPLKSEKIGWKLYK